MAEQTPNEYKSNASTRFFANNEGAIKYDSPLTQHQDAADSFLAFQDLAWGNYQDLTYDSGAPLIVNSLVTPVLYQVDKDKFKKEFRPKTITEELWNSTQNKIVIPEIDRDLEIYIYFKGTADQNNRNLFVELYIPNVDEVIEGNPIPFPRLVESRYVEYLSGTSTQDIVDNGIQVRLYSDGLISVYDMGIRIKIGKKANY
jgi:hypothetical protein